MSIWEFLKETPKLLILQEILTFLLGIIGIVAVLFIVFAILGG